jgi:iron-sulfur cluster repair protein YtfE (RIC family)
MLDPELNKLKEQVKSNKKLIEELSLEIELLEQKRVERLAEVTRNNADEIAQKALKTIEGKLDGNKEKRKELEKKITEISQRYHELQRQRSFKLSDNIQEQLTKAREERDWLRSDFIPALQRQLQDLEERKKELDTLVLSLSNQMSHVNRESRTDDDGTKF